MKAKIRVSVRLDYFVEVDAKDYADAQRAGKGLGLEFLKPESQDASVDVLALNGSFTGRLSPGHNVIVVSAPTGAVFHQRHVPAIRAAARQSGIDVDTHWNGTGTDSLSLGLVEDAEVSDAEMAQFNERIADFDPDYRRALRGTPWSEQRTPFTVA